MSHPTHKSRRLRTIAGVIALSLIPAALVACSGGPGNGSSATVSSLRAPTKPVTIDVWVGFTGPDGDTFKSIVSSIEKDAPNLKVNLTAQADYETKVRAAAQTHTLPDGGVFTDPVNWAVDKIVQPMDDFVKLSATKETEYPAAVWDHSVLSNKRYGIPFDVQPIAFFWNKKLFKQAGLNPDTPPASQEEFIADAQAITQKDGVPGFEVVSGGPGAVFLSGLAWTSLAYQGGMKWTNADQSEATFNDRAGVDAANFLSDMITKYKVSPANVESDTESAAFIQGKNGMLINGVWQTGRLKEALGADLGGAFLPNIFGKGAWASSQQLVTFNTKMSAEQKSALYYFYDQLTKKSVDWAKSGSIPARQSVRDSEAFKSISITSDIAKGLNDVQLFPKFPGASDLLFGTGAAGDAVVAHLTGNTDIQKGLDDAANRYTKIIQQTKKKYGY